MARPLPKGFAWAEETGVLISPNGTRLYSVKALLSSLGVAEPLANWRCKRVAEEAIRLSESGEPMPSAYDLSNVWRKKVQAKRDDGVKRHESLEKAAQVPGTNQALDLLVESNNWQMRGQEVFGYSERHQVYGYADLMVWDYDSETELGLDHKPTPPYLENILQISIWSLFDTWHFELNNPSSAQLGGVGIVYPGPEGFRLTLLPRDQAVAYGKSVYNIFKASQSVSRKGQ